jgi:hypothetical protein
MVGYVKERLEIIIMTVVCICLFVYIYTLKFGHIVRFKMTSLKRHLLNCSCCIRILSWCLECHVRLFCQNQGFCLQLRCLVVLLTYTQDHQKICCRCGEMVNLESQTKQELVVYDLFVVHTD